MNKPVIFLSIMFMSFFLQSNWKAALGWSPEFVMATLVVSVFYLDILETTVLVAVGMFLLNWRPLPGWEIFLFLLFPFLAMSAREVFPWKGGINSVLFSVLSVAAFYAITGFGALAENFAVFVLILALTACFAFALFHALNYFYKVSPA